MMLLMFVTFGRISTDSVSYSQHQHFVRLQLQMRRLLH